jgi:hypothetical protein
MTKARDLADLISAGNPLADGAISVSEISDLTATAAEINQLDNTADLPDIRPSLLLDFANSKTLDPRITFTRGSTATYWDGKTTAKAEENLFKYSQQVDQWPDKTNVTVTADDTTAPDGTTTADRITDSGSGDIAHYALTPISISTSTTYSISCYLKYGSGNGWVLIGFTGGTYAVYFDIQNGTVGTVGSGVSGSSITDVGNGWYRCELQTSMSTSTAYPQVRLAPSDGTATYTANGSYVYAWGAQVEQRSSATAYTPTTDSPIVKYQPVLQTAASGEARFDHDPVTGESKGLLIEEARTNLLTYSVPDSVNWTENSSTILENSLTSPDGTSSASLLVSNTVNLQHQTTINATFSTSTTYTLSIYVKDFGSGSVGFGFGGNGLFNTAAFTFSTEAFSNAQIASGYTNTTYQSEALENGWYRISFIATTPSGSAPTSIRVSDTDFDTVSGDGYSGIYIWGAQLEEGSFPTSYIPTSGSTVTRATDSAKITGANLSGSVSDGEGTFYAEANGVSNVTTAGGGPNYFRFGRDDDNYVSFTATGDDNLYSLHVVNGLTQQNYYSASHSDYTGNTNKAVIAFSLDQNSAFATQPFIKTDQIGWVADGYTTLAIGGRIDSETAGKMTGTIKKIAFYPKRLPNATLQAMTEE